MAFKINVDILNIVNNKHENKITPINNKHSQQNEICTKN